MSLSPDSLLSQMHGFAPEPDAMRYLFIDFNAYFASVEQHDDPSLRGRPVLVTPLPSEHSGAIAVSYEAKALGIKRGTSVREARSLCRDIAVRPARHDRYVAVHHQLMQEIERHLPVLKVCSIDECICRLGADETGVAAARVKALAIKQGIYDNVGPMLRCSIGLASSGLLAKLASDLQKPDGLTAIPSGSLPEALRDLPIRAIAGIGGGVARRLEKAGVTDFLSLWALQPKQARAIWGSVAGERFLYGLKGYDVPALNIAEKRMIGHSRVLSGAHRRPAGARIVARALILKVASRLRHHGLYAGAMHVSVRLHPEGSLGQDIDFRATQNSWCFLEALDEAWPKMMRFAHARVRETGVDHLSLKLVSIYLNKLGQRPPEPDLFQPASLDIRDACEAQLWSRIDGLNRRYGMQKILLASQSGLDLNYLGVKIAFSRVPSAEEFADLGGK